MPMQAVSGVSPMCVMMMVLMLMCTLPMYSGSGWYCVCAGSTGAVNCEGPYLVCWWAWMLLLVLCARGRPEPRLGLGPWDVHGLWMRHGCQLLACWLLRGWPAPCPRPCPSWSRCCASLL